MSSSGLSLSHELKQVQRLTPMQVQFVRMLEMTGPEMEDEVQRALDEMPALEAVAPEEALSSSQPTEDGSEFAESGLEVQRADFRNEDEMPDYLGYASPSDSPLTSLRTTSSRRDPYGASSLSPIDNSSDTGASLLEELSAQLAELSLTPTQQQCALHIIGSIDDNGYMTRSPQAIADDLAINEGIDLDPAEVEAVWRQIRAFDPPGIAATDLRDCLLLQLSRLPRTTESVTAMEILRNCFDLFSKKHFDRIASQLGITPEAVKSALALITRLNPKPASGFAGSALDDRSRHITPDFSVEPTTDGKLTVALLNRVPELRIEATFADDTPYAEGTGTRFDEARTFIRSKRDDARNFIRVVSMRQETLFNVMSAIARLQRPFFLTDDDEEIRPMVLKDVAAETGYDLSVISRATQGKYVATLRGLYPLKKFFNEKIRDDNDQVTANRIIAEIKSAIEAEDPTDPLSDREITERLAASGFDIARRTVAKYRESLGFPVARLRKKF